MGHILRTAALVLIALAAILAVRTAIFASRQPAIPTATQRVSDLSDAAAKLAGAVRFRTVSSRDSKTASSAEFSRLHDYLRETFPRVHAVLQSETVAGHSLLYTWRGQQPDASAALFAAHLDVVPVEPQNVDRWTHPPFAGSIADGFIWGRGAMDDKVAVVAILEALERLIAEDYRPRNTVYLAFGHDEELGGHAGAAQVAARLAERAVRVRFVLDEGLVVTDRVLPLVTAPVALVGIAEKGYLTIELVVESEGGHASMPPTETAVGILGSAIARLEEHPMPARLETPVRLLFDYIGPEMSLLPRLILANQWLFQPLLLRRLTAAPATNASVRTTAAPTLVAAGVKENVLPAHARAVINFRILPGDSVETVLRHVRETIADDRVRVRPTDSTPTDPSGISSTDSRDFTTLIRTIRQVMPDVLVAPSLAIPATDSRHYADLADNVYRFLPVRAHPEDLQRFHGIDERIAIENFAECVEFYYQFIRSTAGQPD